MISPEQPPGEGHRKLESGSQAGASETPSPILRENAEPRFGYQPIPLWLLPVFFCIILWAGLYMEDNSGGFRADVFEVSDAAEADRRTDTTGPIDPKILGKRVFTQSCVVCHQITGLGVPGQFPPLAGSEWVTGGDWHGDNHLVAILLKGLQGPVQVKGMTFNNAMPTWRQLSDEQIAAVLNYIRSEWGNAAAPISSDYVKAIREQTAGRVEPWTAKTLQTMPPEKVPPLPAPGPSPTPAPALPADLSKRGVSKR